MFSADSSLNGWEFREGEHTSQAQIDHGEDDGARLRAIFHRLHRFLSTPLSPTPEKKKF